MSYFCATSAIMIKDKLQLSAAVKFMLSSTFVSIVVSMCLLVNLFTPNFSTIFKSKKGTFPCEHHTCGCKTAPDCLDHCCCAIEANTSEKESLPKEDSEGLFTTFIQSLACAGIPDQFTPIPYKVFTIAGGLFGISIPTFIIASTLGRGGRFFTVAVVMRFFGGHIARMFYQYFNIISFAVVAVLGAILYVFFL